MATGMATGMAMVRAVGKKIFDLLSLSLSFTLPLYRFSLLLSLALFFLSRSPSVSGGRAGFTQGQRWHGNSGELGELGSQGSAWASRVHMQDQR